MATSTSKPELIDTRQNKVFEHRAPQGRFREMDDVRRSLAKNRRTMAKTVSKSGMASREMVRELGRRASSDLDTAFRLRS